MTGGSDHRRPSPRSNELDRVLLVAARGVGLLAAMTPTNAAAERARLSAIFSAGGADTPRWTYRPGPGPAVGQALDAARLALHLLSVDRGFDAGLSDLYRARCEELALELSLVENRGCAAFAGLSQTRFGCDDRAATLAGQLAQSPLEAPEETETCLSDGAEPASLLRQVRALVGALRIPFRVEVRRDLVPLAATGDGVILIAEGRPLTASAARRTAIHEVYGHALPRARAAQQPLRLFAVGTAAGVDEQEGYALLLEERAGYLVGRRARELAARHDAVVNMRAGADFGECVRRLRDEHRLPIDSALRTAERAYRGGDGKSAGLGRECVYLASFLRVREYLAREPDDERILGSGQVSVAAAPVLRAYYVGA